MLKKSFVRAQTAARSKALVLFNAAHWVARPFLQSRIDTLLKRDALPVLLVGGVSFFRHSLSTRLTKKRQLTLFEF